jgi:hypothetical protein
MKPLLKSALGFQVKMQGIGRMAQADIEAEFTRHLKRIELVLNQTGWLVGDQQTIADIAVASQLLEIVRTSQKFGAQILGHTMFNSVLKRVSPAVVSLIVFFEVPTSSIFALWWLNQRPPAGVIPGIVLILIGCVLVVLRTRPTRVMIEE